MKDLHTDTCRCTGSGTRTHRLWCVKRWVFRCCLKVLTMVTVSFAVGLFAFDIW